MTMLKMELMKEMQDFVVGKLQESGEFSDIIVGYHADPTSSFSDKRFNLMADRHVLARKKKSGSDEEAEEYLIIANATRFSRISDFINKINFIRRNRIFVLPLFYKGSESDFFKYDCRHGKPSRKEYKMEDRQRQIRTTKYERWMDEQAGHVIYFNPYVKSLEMIKFISGLWPDYSHREDIVADKEDEYVTIMDHKSLGCYLTFTLSAGQGGFAVPSSLSSLESRIGNSLAFEDAIKRNRQKNPSLEDAEERTAIMLANCREEDRKKLAGIFSAKRLGILAVEF